MFLSFITEGFDSRPKNGCKWMEILYTAGFVVVFVGGNKVSPENGESVPDDVSGRWI